MTLLENLVIPDDGKPFRYDVLVTRRGRREVDRHLNLANPVGRAVQTPDGQRVPNDLFESTETAAWMFETMRRSRRAA